MSDEEESYNSSDDSEDEKTLTNTIPKPADNNTNGTSGPKTGVLTLVDDDNDNDEQMFKRPAFAFDEDEGESEEFSGESETESDFGNKKRLKKSKTLTGKSNTRQVSKYSYNSDQDDGKKSAAAKKKKKKQIGICVAATKYDCVRRVGRKLGFKEVEENEDWSIFWTDLSVSIDRVNQMKRWQKINHYPGMSEICRKDFLTRNMNRMAKLYPKDYAFFPKSWCLPADYADLANYARLKKNKTYICKPDSGCQGKGIFITKNPNKDIKPGDNFVAQVYVSRPFIIDGFKFDLRVYVAVTSCDPFRIFVYKEGLARFTTNTYEEPTHSNCKDVFMHLTNYAIQKRSDDFLRDEESGTKRRISTMNKWFRDNGYDVEKMWNDIDDVIIKTLLSAHAVLKHNYRTCFANHYKGSACFEILGYDILLDKKLKPYVLEVNHSPSFTTDSKLDREIKDALIYDTIMLLNLGSTDKRKCVEEERKRVRERLFLKQGKKETKFINREELDEVLAEWLKQIEKWEDAHMGNYRRVYPCPGYEKYDKFYNNTGTLFSETAASRARIEQAKQQMIDVSKKNEKFMVNRNKEKIKTQVESRGESPGRKGSYPAKAAGATGTNGTGSNPTTPGTLNKKLSTLSRNSSMVPITNNTINISINDINGANPLRKLERASSSCAKNQLQQMGSINRQQLPLPSPSHPSLNDTMRPLEINELDEMERIQSLKHRENLIKGMGITDFVNRILYGTPGTVATVPPSLVSHTHHSKSNNATRDGASNNANGGLSKNLNSYNPNMELITQPERNYTTYNPKIEIKTKNYNPFENHSLFSEKNSTQIIRATNNAFRNLKTSNSTGTNVNSNNINNNIISNGNNSAVLQSSSQTNSGRLTKPHSQDSNSTTNGTSNGASGQYRYQFNSQNYNDATFINQQQQQKYINLSTLNNATKTNLNGSNLQQASHHLIEASHKQKNSRYPIELFSKKDMNNQQTKLLNSYRIQSAQNLAKQRSTGLHIYSYQRPTTNNVPES